MKIKNKYKIMAGSLLVLLGLTFQDCRVVQASETSVRPRLIMTTSPVEEYEARRELGLMDVEIRPDENLEYSAGNVLDSVVQINCGGSIGSGTVVYADKDRIVIASNKHVLLFDVVAKVYFDDTTYVEGTILGLSEQYDVGFVEIAVDKLSSEQIRSMKRVMLSKENDSRLANGSPLFLMGSTDGVAANIYKGVVISTWEFISDLNNYMMKSNCYAKPGMSGGAAFDAYGNYIGMITGGNEEFTVCVPLDTIVDEFARIVDKNK